MKTITVSDETAEFISNFVNQIETQDNRSTASPYYYVVRCVKLLTAADSRGCAYQYYDSDACESFTEEQLRQHCDENDIEDVEAYIESESLEKIEVQEVDEYVNVFFTYDGYKKHIKLNGHNYRHCEKFDSYVMHAFRNPEIEGLLKSIKEIGQALK